MNHLISTENLKVLAIRTSTFNYGIDCFNQPDDLDPRHFDDILEHASFILNRLKVKVSITKDELLQEIWNITEKEWEEMQQEWLVENL